MIPRSLIKKSLDDWQSWSLSALQRLTQRETQVVWPQGFGLALTGVRRSGKTYLALQMAHRRSPKLLYFNFEDPIFFQDNDVGNLDTIISVYTEFSGQEPGVVVLDEIQNIPGWERWVRKYIDIQRWPIIITGSSAKLLSSEIATSIGGRCIEHHLWPLSFSEYLTFSQTQCTTPDTWLSALRLYMKHGGFPAVVQEADEHAKAAILEQYLTDVLYKDVMGRHEIRARRSLDQIVLFSMTNLSSLFSYQSIRKAFGMTVELAQDYLGFLNDAFLLFEVPRFHANLKVQSRDPKKMYVIDTGMRNVHARSMHEDIGKIAENIVYLELRRRRHDIYYYQDHAEVDFVIVKTGKPTQAIQVCYSDMENEATFARETDSLVSCVKHIHLDRGTILTMNRQENIIKDGVKIEMIPLYQFLTSGVPSPDKSL